MFTTLVPSLRQELSILLCFPLVVEGHYFRRTLFLRDGDALAALTTSAVVTIILTLIIPPLSVIPLRIEYIVAIVFLGAYFAYALIVFLRNWSWRWQLTCAVAVQLIGISALLSLVIYFLVYPLLSEVITYGFSWQVNLPFQSRAVVFLEYAAPCGVLLCQKKYLASLWGLVFPIYYLLDASEVMRLHHSFTGLVLLCAPSWPLQYLGTCLTLDSAMYMIVPDRSNYDLMNVVIDFAPMLAIIYSVAVVFSHWRPEQMSCVL